MLGKAKVPTRGDARRPVEEARSRRRRLAWRSSILALVLAFAWDSARALVYPPGAPLAASIRKLARERRIEILFAPNLLTGLTARSADTAGPIDVVLSRLLEGSGLVARRTADGTYYLGKATTHPAARPAAPVAKAPPLRDSAARELDLPPIIVTGRKRDELLTHTPLSIAAFSARQISDRGARKLEDLLPFAPGVQLSQQGFLRPGRIDANVRIRGMSVNIGTPQEQLATVFVDGVPVSDGIQSLSLEDAERVEVINGPQSAIFGRSTFGGAINIIIRPPSDTPRLRSETILETNGVDANASVEGPIIPGKLVGRLSARLLRVRGDYRNPAVPGQRLGGQQTDSIAANLRLSVGDFSASGRIRYSHDDDGPPAGWALGVVEANCGPFGGGFRQTICGSLPGLGNARFGQNTDDAPAIHEFLRQNGISGVPSAYGMDRSTWSAGFKAAWIIPAANLRLEANGGLNRRHRKILSDSDQGPDRVTVAYYPMRSTDRSLEVRARPQVADRLNWSLGASYFDQRYRETVEGIYGALVLPFNYRPACTSAPVQCDPATRIPGAGDLYLGTLPYFIGHVRTKALFGSAEYRLSPTVAASAELRREWDRVEDPTLPGRTLSQDFSAFLYRAVLSYHLSDRAMAYLSTSNGNLPGRFNASVIGASASTRQLLAAAGAPDTLPQQTLRNVEAGLKFQRSNAALSLSAYRMHWRNQRLRQTFFDTQTQRTISYLEARGSSRLQGVEVQASWKPTDWLHLDLTADVSDARYRRQSSLIALRVLGTDDVSGKRIPGSPLYSGTLSATISGRLDRGRTWYARGDSIYRGRLYLDELNLTTLPAAFVLSARAGLRDDRFGIELFATDILQSRHPLFAAAQADISAYVPAFDFTYPGFITEAPPRRRIGIKLTSAF